MFVGVKISSHVFCEHANVCLLACAHVSVHYSWMMAGCAGNRVREPSTNLPLILPLGTQVENRP